MKKLIILLIPLLLLSSCVTTKYLSAQYRIIEIEVDHVDEKSRPISYGAIIKMNGNYYSALLDENYRIIYVSEFLGNRRDFKE